MRELHVPATRYRLVPRQGSLRIAGAKAGSMSNLGIELDEAIRGAERE